MQTGRYKKRISSNRFSYKHQSLRWNLFQGAGIFCLFVLCAGITTSLIVMRKKDYENTVTRQKKENAVEDQWSSTFRDAIIETLVVSNIFEGYIISDLKKLPNISDPPEERVKDQDFSSFHILASMAVAEFPSIVMQAVSPGGVFSFTYPRNESIEGIDMFQEDYYKRFMSYTPEEVMLRGNAVFNGPWDIEFPSREKLWIIQVCQPVYNATGNEETNSSRRKNFWGFVTINLNLTHIIQSNSLDERVRAEGMDYLLYSVNQDKTVVEVATSLVNPTNEEINAFINSSSGNLPLLYTLGFTVAIRSHDLSKIATNATVTIVISSALLACVVLFAVLSALIICYTHECNELENAPKAAPFAILTLGPTNGEKLWGSNPEEMDILTEKLNIILSRNARTSHAYSTPQLQPYTRSYVFRRVGDAVHMALAVGDELHRRPIDKTMQLLLGEDGRLLLAYAVHWCVDASVRPSPYASSGYLYEGPDVVYGGRMWIFAVPNVITLSEAAKEALKNTNPPLYSRVEFFNSVYIRGVNNRQNLFIIENYNTTKANQSLARAVWQLRYIGQPQHFHLSSSCIESNGNQLNVSTGLIHVLGPRDTHDNFCTDLEDRIGLLDNESSHSTNSSNSLIHVLSMRGDAILRATDVNTNAHTLLSSPGKQHALVTCKNGMDVCSANRDFNAARCASNEAPLVVANQLSICRPTKVAERQFLSGALENIDIGPVGTRQQQTSISAQTSKQSKNRSNSLSPGDPPTFTTNQLSSDVQSTSEIRFKEVIDLMKCRSGLAKSSPMYGCNNLTARRGHFTDGRYKTSVDGAELSGSATLFPTKLHAFMELPNKNSSGKGSSSCTPISRYFSGTPKQPQLIKVPFNPLFLAEVLTETAREGKVNERSWCSSSRDSSNSRAICSGSHNRWVGNNDILRFNASEPLGLQENAAESSLQIRPHSNTVPTFGLASSSIQHPPIQGWLDASLRAAFEQQAVAIDISYESVRVLLYFFFQSLNLLFHPLMKAEKANIFDRFATALGIGQQGTLENLAVRCIIQYMQQHERELTLWWDQMLKKQEEMRQ